ncbi:MAG: putative redox protein [Thermoproteota archaeon]|nr:putative redox protein [Thermoproteota archaeon]
MNWQGNYRFTTKNEKGLSVDFDAPIPNGGEETALSPMENVLASLAACSSYHVVSILHKKRQDFSVYSIEMEADRRDEPPRVFTGIHLKYIIKGKNISKKAVENAIRLSEEEYCSVGGMLKKTVNITSSYEISA